MSRSVFGLDKGLKRDLIFSGFIIFCLMVLFFYSCKPDKIVIPPKGDSQVYYVHSQFKDFRHGKYADSISVDGIDIYMYDSTGNSLGKYNVPEFMRDSVVIIAVDK